MGHFMFVFFFFWQCWMMLPPLLPLMLMLLLQMRCAREEQLQVTVPGEHPQVKHLIRNLDAEESARAVEAAAAGAWPPPPLPRNITLSAAKKQGKLEYQVGLPMLLA